MARPKRTLFFLRLPLQKGFTIGQKEEAAAGSVPKINGVIYNLVFTTFFYFSFDVDNGLSPGRSPLDGYPGLVLQVVHRYHFSMYQSLGPDIFFSEALIRIGRLVGFT